MSQPLKIALAHLNHATVGRHSVYMPINIGYIGAYARKLLGAGNVEVRLYAEHEPLLGDLAGWKPDVLGTANYIWNSEFGLTMMRAARDDNPDIVCVAGGPEIPETPEDRRAYLAERPEIDFYAYLEGELPFGRLVERLAGGETARELRREAQDGLLCLHPKTGALLEGEPMLRPMDMDVIPSPYLTGLMDQWFDGTYAPSIETARGCPFKCGFCFQGQRYFSTIARFSVERINDELTYIAKRMKETPGILLNICDSNFAMYKRDEEIAEHLRSLQDTFGWPNAFNVTTGKANYDRIMKITGRLGNKMRVSASVQSLNDETLETIQRKNLPWEKFVEIQEEMKKRGMITMSEMIVPMPRETKESFFAGLEKLNNVGIDFLSPYTAMLLKGTFLAKKKTREKYKMVGKFRVLPRQFGEYKGRRSFEIEEVCVATDTMPFEDYLECRGFGLISVVFTYTQFDVIHRHLKELGITSFDFIFAAWKRIRGGGTELTPIYEDYLKTCRDELFDSREEIYNYFNKDENYRKLLDGECGDNLIRRYKNVMIVDVCIPALRLAYDVLEMISEKNLDAKGRLALRAARDWALATRDVGAIFHGEPHAFKPRRLTTDFDVDAWYHKSQGQRPLADFQGTVSYHVTGDHRTIERILDQARRLFGDDYNFWMPKTLNNWSISEFWLKCRAERVPV